MYGKYSCFVSTCVSKFDFSVWVKKNHFRLFCGDSFSMHMQQATLYKLGRGQSWLIFWIYCKQIFWSELQKGFIGQPLLFMRKWVWHKVVCLPKMEDWSIDSPSAFWCWCCQSCPVTLAKSRELKFFLCWWSRPMTAGKRRQVWCKDEIMLFTKK